MKIAFLGDSITMGYALQNPEDRYTTRICHSLGAEEINFGITGTLMAKAGLNRNDERAFIDRLHFVQEANPDFLIIFGGTNDYFWSDMPIGDENSTSVYFHGAVEAICSQCITFLNPSCILIVTPYPHNGIGNFAGGTDFMDRSRHDTNAPNYNGHCLEDYANILVKAANKYHIPVLNLHADGNFDWKKYTSDGCHPNPEGHQWLAERILPLISVK